MYLNLVLWINISGGIILLIGIFVVHKKWLLCTHIVWMLGFISLLLFVLIANKEQ